MQGGVDSKNLFDNYIMLWVEDMQLNLLDLCKAEKVSLLYSNFMCSLARMVCSLIDMHMISFSLSTHSPFLLYPRMASTFMTSLKVMWLANVLFWNSVTVNQLDIHSNDAGAMVWSVNKSFYVTICRGNV